MELDVAVFSNIHGWLVNVRNLHDECTIGWIVVCLV